MSLWVRSQDKTRLIKANNLRVEFNSWHNKSGIFCDGNIIGEYKTKERALQILDEIQNLITPRFILKSGSDIDQVENLFDKSTANKCFISTLFDIKQIENDCIVYQMPKE